VTTNAFLLSRIYRQGWNAARKLLAQGSSDVDDAQAATLNPYRAGEERDYWLKGFLEASQSRTTPFGAGNWRAHTDK